jgi:type III restriction enzyme
MLVNLNPDFILDLTATPRNNSNIISYVDALALKRNHMVKLPVIVANRTNRSEVIESTLILRRQLEEIAKAEESKGGKYIRPIVLFQAQSRTNEDNTTYEKIKEKLIELKIPAEQIKIKTADINELKGVDLMSRDCSVRYIITVNALKEGWDCPFAYVLASLADKSSPVDVEQILGRVLRMPHVQQHGHDLLNLSYVFTASSKFADTLQSVVKALNRAGFSDKDYRTFDADVATENQPTPTNGTLSLIGDVSPSTVGVDVIDTSTISPDWNAAATTEIDPAGSLANSVAFVEEVKAQAVVENKDFEAKAVASTNLDVPSDLEEKMNKYKLKEIFRSDALALKLPQFHLRMQTGGWFDDANILQIFERNELLRDFKLSHADSNLNFEDVESEMYRVDLEKVGEQDYTPKPFKMDSASRKRFNSVALAGSRDNQVRNVTARITQLIGNMYPITDPEIKQYVFRIVNGMEIEQLQDCLERDVSYVRKIKQKIEMVADAHAYKVFNDLLDIDRIVVRPSFNFPEIITPSANAPSLPKSLYSTEASVGDFEGRVINAVANLESVLWWHRNLSRGKGFRINGFINHYPDFILKMKSGRIIVLETKGDDRDNSDSEMKLKLGRLWESRSGGNFKYMMTFDNNPFDGAERLADALKKIGQM